MFLSASVAQGQSNGFVNHRLWVRIPPLAGAQLSPGEGVTWGVCVNLGRYPSGQRGQTVNLLAKPSQVRILLSPGFVYVDAGCFADVAQW